MDSPSLSIVCLLVSSLSSPSPRDRAARLFVSRRLEIAAPTAMNLTLDRLIVPAGSHALLQQIGWDAYETLLHELGQNRASQIVYDNGDLEIMTPLPEHGFYKTTLSIAIKEVADSLERDYACYGSTTWRSALQQLGVEPDDCFYIQNEAIVRGRTDLDLAIDPPPDLVLEIDITNKSLDRFSIYARLGVPEIWRYANGALQAYVLTQDTYEARSTSIAFPGLPVGELVAIVSAQRSAGRRAMRRAVREWAAGFRANN